MYTFKHLLRLSTFFYRFLYETFTKTFALVLEGLCYLYYIHNIVTENVKKPREQDFGLTPGVFMFRYFLFCSLTSSFQEMPR